MRQKRRVLVVDDNKPFADALLYFLRGAGHDVWITNSGEDAIPQARENNVDVILLDIGLPGEDGYQVAKRIRETPDLEKVMLIAMSGYEPEKHKSDDLFDKYFVKSNDPQELLDTL